MECKLRSVNFRRELDSRRAFWPALRVTGMSDDWNRSTMGVFMIGLGIPGIAWECRQQAWEYPGTAVTILEVVATTVEAA